MQRFFDQARWLFMKSTAARWFILTLFGWFAGLNILTIALSQARSDSPFVVTFIVITTGIACSVCVGIAQWAALWPNPPAPLGRWLLISTIGIGGGTLAGIGGLCAGAFCWGWLPGFAFLGFWVGAGLGTTQSDILGNTHKQQWLWIIANTAAGLICGSLSTSGLNLTSGMFCSIGPLAFGGITALALVWLSRQTLTALDQLDQPV